MKRSITISMNNNTLNTAHSTTMERDNNRKEINRETDKKEDVSMKENPPSITS